MANKLWRCETWLFLCLLLGLAWIGQTQFLFDPGSFWSTVIGQRILTTHDVPRQEEFSCTFEGTPWQSHQWLAQVVMATLHAIGGLDALVLGAAAILAATYAWASGRVSRAGGLWITTAVVLALLLWSSHYHWLARPQLVTIALLGWTFAQLVDFEAGVASWRRLCWLPVVIALWTNLHGGALGGLCTVGFVFGGWGAAWLIGWPSPLKSIADLGRIALLGVVCVLATLVNPYGLELPLLWVRLMSIESLSKYIYEHMPLDWANPYQRGIPVFGLVYAFALATVPVRHWRVSWLVPIIWFVLTVQRVRHCTLFSITAAVAIADVLPHSRLLAWSMKPVAVSADPVVAPENKGLAWVIPMIVVILALVAQACSIPVPLIGARQAQIDPGLFPTDLIEPIRQRSKPNDPIFNEMAYGGFLIYYMPELRLYIDDRCELYGEEVIAQQMELAAFFNKLRQEEMDPAPHDQLERWTEEKGIHLALVTKNGGFDYYFSNVPQRWTRVAETKGRVSPVSLPGAVLYERTKR